MRDKGLFVSISSGVKQADRDVIDQLAAEGVGADYITIDIAHGHADSVLRMIEYIKTTLPGGFVIAGNVATPEAVIDLENWRRRRYQGRCRPGQGVHHQAEDRLRHWRLAAQRAEVVCPRGDQADHRRRRHPRPWRHRQERALRCEHGDDRLALRRPRGVTRQDGRGRRWLYKEYYGSASDFNKGEYKHVEGKRILEPIKGRLADTLREMREDVQSSISYAGGRRAGRPEEGELRDARRRERRRAPVHVAPTTDPFSNTT